MRQVRAEQVEMHGDAGDERLVRAAQGGDVRALAVLIDRHRPLLLALCRRTLRDAILAEDAAQEAVLQAMLSLDRLREPERFGPWLAGIGLNVCRRWLRQARRSDYWSWEALHGGWRAAEPADGRPGPEALAEEADLAERVRAAVADLPRGQRAAVLLCYLSGLTYAETAAQLGIDVGTVRTRLHKARATLRRKLSGLWKEEVMPKAAKDSAIEMRVADVRWRPAERGAPGTHAVVVLEEVGGTRRLPIWIGRFEAEAMALQIADVHAPRPLTYATMAKVLAALGSRLREVRIVRLTGEVFYATLVAEGRKGASGVDARPSDAINLALAAGAPIRAEPAVLRAVEEAASGREVALPDPFGEGTLGALDLAAEVRAGWPAYCHGTPDAK